MKFVPCRTNARSVLVPDTMFNLVKYIYILVRTSFAEAPVIPM